jgi:putative transposase
MARPSRIEFSGAFYHVTHCGTTGTGVFSGGRDRKKFLEYLGKSAERFGFSIHCCLMTDHHHLLIETPQPNLSQVIKWIDFSHAVYFNFCRKHFGLRFLERFKAILMDANRHLKRLSRHIQKYRRSSIRPAAYVR